MMNLGLRLALGTSLSSGGVAPAVPAVFTMTQLALADRIYQRDTTTGGAAGKGQGTIPVMLNVTTGGTLYARCRSAADGTTILQATFLVAVISGGIGPVDIPGIDARLGFFFLDLSGDGVTWKNGTKPVGMGVLMLVAGQSLMVRMVRTQEDSTTIAAAGVAVPPNGRVFAVADTNDATLPSVWVIPADGTDIRGAGVSELMRLLIATAGVNVGVVGKLQGATSITNWLPGQTYGDAMLATMDLAGGKYELVWWYQGHGDSGAVMGESTYSSHLDTFFAGIAGRNRFASPVLMLSSLPNVSGYGTEQDVETIRRASARWAVAHGGIPVTFNDIELISDKTHPNQIGAVRQARHAYRALRPYFGLSNDDVGATFGSPIHAPGVNLVVPFTLPTGATAISAIGSPATRFRVFKYGDRASPLAFDATTPLTIDNVAKTLTFKLASDPGQVSLEIIRAGVDTATPDGSANALYNNLTDSDGLTQGRLVHGGIMPARVWAGRDLTLTTPAYGAGKFGNTLTAGYGTTTGPVLPSPGFGMTVEFWAIVDATSGSTCVFFSSANLWVGVVGNDLKVSLQGTTTTFANALPTGSWCHVALCFPSQPLSAQTYVNGVAQTAITTSAYKATDPASIRSLGGGFVPTTQRVDEVAIFEGPRYSGNFTPPVSAYVGDEPGLVALWHLNGDGLNLATPPA